MNTLPLSLSLACAALIGCGGTSNSGRESDELTAKDWAKITAEEDDGGPSQMEATDSPGVKIDTETTRLLAAFLANPKGEVSPEDVIALTFEDLEAEVTIDGELFRSKGVGEPGKFDEEPRNTWAMLNAGFVAGNVQAQLEVGVKGDNREAGICGLLKVYDALKTLNEIELVPRYEELLAERPGCL